MKSWNLGRKEGVRARFSNFEFFYATFENTSATFTFAADHAGKRLPKIAAKAPRSGPHQKAWNGTYKGKLTPLLRAAFTSM